MNLLSVYEAQRSAPDRFTPEKNIRGNIKGVDDLKFLVNCADSKSGRISGRVDRNGFSIEVNCPFVRQVNAREDLHQRRLASAVFADQSDDLTAPDGTLNRFESRDTRKLLRNPGHFKHACSFPDQGS